MKKAIFIVFSFPIIVTGFIVVISHAQNKSSKTAKIGTAISALKTIRDIPMNGGANRFDYQSINPLAKRLYISHMYSDMLTVFDLSNQTVITDIKGISRPTGVLAVPELGKIYVSASRANEVVVIDEHSLKILKRIPSGAFPDGIAYDPNTKKIFVSDEHGKQVTVIDALSDKFVENIDMSGEVGNTHYDPISKKIYSAVQTKDELVCIDPVNDKIVKRFVLNGCQSPHGFFIDPSSHYALITGEESGQFIVFDLESYKIIYTDKVGSDPDVLAFDAGLHRLYVSSESGVMAIYKIEKNNIKKISEIFIAKHAHTVSVDQQSHLIYFPLEAINSKPVLRIMEVQK